MRTIRIAAIAVLSAVLTITAGIGAVRHRHPAKPAEANAIPAVGRGVEFVSVEGSLRAAWVQYGPGGVLEARAAVEGAACPVIYIDLKNSVMQPRAAAGDGFLTVCRAVIPAGARQAALVFQVFKFPQPKPDAGDKAWREWSAKETGIPMPELTAGELEWRRWADETANSKRYDIVPLPLPVSDPQRIVVIGDTGCRIKGSAVQDCSDPEKWPFARLAAEAAKRKPDLVIHVGDYISRESACPADVAVCQGSSWGDNWPAWDADFFKPARPLLSAAPWVVVRGNHEDCHRAGPGWLRLMGSEPYVPGAPCTGHLPPYSVPLGGLHLVVMDDADAPEQSVVADEVPVYRDEFAALAREPSQSWLLLHRPVWGAISGPLGIPVGGNLTLMAAVPGGIPAPVELMLSGHIHSFEVFNYRAADHVPPQIVAGFGGDLLDSTPANLRGTIFQGDSGVRVADGLTLGGFGFLLMTKTENDWQIDVTDSHGRITRICRFGGGRVDCPARRKG